MLLGRFEIDSDKRIYVLLLVFGGPGKRLLSIWAAKYFSQELSYYQLLSKVTGTERC